VIRRLHGPLNGFQRNGSGFADAGKWILFDCQHGPVNSKYDRLVHFLAVLSSRILATGHEVGRSATEGLKEFFLNIQLHASIALTRYLPISDPQSLFDIELPKPVAADRDLLVRIEAISVNPVDIKVRAPKDKVEAQRTSTTPMPTGPRWRN